MRALLLLAMLPGCMAGPNEETVIDELRVVAAVAEPPAVDPGGEFDLEVTVADPVGDGFELLVWSCDTEGACASARPEPDDLGRAVVPSVGLAPVPQWILACAPGACDVDAATPAQLLDPTSWLAELPIEGVSAAFRQVRVEVDSAVENPVVEEVGSPALAEATPDEPVTLSFLAPGATTAYGRSTVGGFGEAAFEVAADGRVELDWYGPGRKDDGPGTVYVVFEGPDGAGAVVQLPVP